MAGERALIPLVVLNFNGGADTVRCLESLRSSKSPLRPLVVVDNGSTDGSAELLASALAPGEVLILNQRNEGAAGGWNTGLLYALGLDPTYVLLVSNDTTVEAGVVDELAAYMDDHVDVGVCGPRLHSMSDPALRVEYAAVDAAAPIDLPHVPVVAFMVRASVVREVGFFDEEMFVHWEDGDYGSRVLGVGYRLVYVPTRAKVLHRGGVTTAKLRQTAPYFFIRNEFLYRRRYPRPDKTALRLVAQSVSNILGWRMPPDIGLRAIVAGLILWVANPSPRWMATRTVELRTSSGDGKVVRLGQH